MVNTQLNIRSTVTLHTGNVMPILGLGTWQLTQDTAGTIAEALRIGYRMIDTSGDYGTQPGIGEGIKQSGIDRKALYIITKVEETDDAYAATRKNLSELQLEYADLMLIHRPPADGPGEELWRGLIRAKEDGLARDIGLSNYSISQMQALIDETGEVPTINQIEWSPFGYSVDMFTYCRDQHIIIQAYSPLTQGKRLHEPVLTAIAAKYNKSPAQVLIRWNLELGTVPIIKASRRQHLEENISVFDFELAKDDIDRLNNLNEYYSALGGLQYIEER